MSGASFSCTCCGYHLDAAGGAPACPECGASTDASERYWAQLGGEARAKAQLARLLQLLVALVISGSLFSAGIAASLPLAVTTQPMDLLRGGLFLPAVTISAVGAVALLGAGAAQPFRVAGRRQGCVRAAAVAWIGLSALTLVGLVNPPWTYGSLWMASLTWGIIGVSILPGVMLLPIPAAVLALRCSPAHSIRHWHEAGRRLRWTARLLLATSAAVAGIHMLTAVIWHCEPGLLTKPSYLRDAILHLPIWLLGMISILQAVMGIAGFMLLKRLARTEGGLAIGRRDLDCRARGLSLIVAPLLLAGLPLGVIGAAQRASAGGNWWHAARHLATETGGPWYPAILLGAAVVVALVWIYSLHIPRLADRTRRTTTPRLSAGR